MVDVFYYDAFQKTINPEPEGGPLVRHSAFTELTAENERLRALVMAQSRAIHSPEALASTGAVKVKTLDWVELNEGKVFRALLPVIGSIRIEPYGVCGWWEVLWSMPGQCDKLIPDVFDTPDEAKAAAQADYERRILSSLVSHTRDANPVVSHEAANMRDKPATLEATPTAPKVTEAMSIFDKHGLSSLINKDQHDAVVAALEEAITAAQEAGKP